VASGKFYNPANPWVQAKAEELVGRTSIAALIS